MEEETNSIRLKTNPLMISSRNESRLIFLRSGGHIMILVFVGMIIVSGCGVVKKDSEPTITLKKVFIEALGKEFTPNTNRVLATQMRMSMGGSTSVRNVSAEHLEWKNQGYHQRNRDLGQVFQLGEDAQLRSVVLRTGPSDKAVLEATPGAKVFIQFFEVTGKPVINDNGTPIGTKAKHGFSEAHRCDDFIEGITYTPTGPIFEGVFPDIKPSFANGTPVNGDDGKLQYMRWILDEPFEIKGKHRYAFIVGFVVPGEGLGFTLANTNMAGLDAPPSLVDEYDAYPHGWGIRREGDGTLPPLMFPGEHESQDKGKLQRLKEQALFPTGDMRFRLPPSTDGYPDVDTYRDLVFVLEKDH